VVAVEVERVGARERREEEIVAVARP
jgi:hypothetical protein